MPQWLFLLADGGTAVERRKSLISGAVLVLLAVTCAVTAGAESKWTKKFTADELRLKGKKGVCFTLREPGQKNGKKTKGTWDINMTKVQLLNPSWNYSWGLDRVRTQPDSIEFVPMVWGGGKNIAESLRRRVRSHVKAGRVKRLLGFNEPDGEKQANMPYMKAIELWPELMKLGVPLCSPACANSEGINDDSVQGVKGTWMRDFMQEAEKRGYRVDYVGVHWYGGTSASHFKAKMKRIYEKYGRRPLLITEFAPADWKAKTPQANRHSPERVLAFMKEVLPWIEEQEWIAGYAWFSFGIDSCAGNSSALFGSDGRLTACGRYYRSVTPGKPTGDQAIKPDEPHHK